MAYHTTWTDAADALLRKHYPEDMHMDDLRAILGKELKRPITKNMVVGRARRLGLTRDDDLNRESWLLKKNGYSAKEIADAIGCTARAATSKAHRHQQHLAADARDLSICASIDKGLPLRSIARDHGVSLDTVQKLRDALEETE